MYRWQKAGGITRYFTEIISHLPSEWRPVLFGADCLASNLPPHPRLQVSPLSSIRPRRFSQPLKLAYWKQHLLGRADLLHPTYYSLSGGLKYTDIKCPIVVTVHDFIGATYPHLEDYSEATIRWQREAILAASRIICVSKYTERDLLHRYPKLAERTTVIYHGSSFPVCEGKQTDDIFREPRFLYVGRRSTYKNFSFLLKAFAAACECHSTIRLHVAGAPLTSDERWQIHFLGLTNRVDSSVFPSLDNLRGLYKGAVALLYPSRHEGFGIPPLEAMACGTIAVTSNTTSLPEVVADAGIMLDPTREKDWAECILHIANQKIARSGLLERGRARARVLSWDASVEQHLRIYNEFSSNPISRSVKVARSPNANQ
jgi:glycosyltransferase involved in cell wall biosynthesis